LKAVIYHPEARLELDETEDYYSLHSLTAPNRFLEEYLSAFNLIRQNPNRYHSYLHNTQRLVLQKFPYSIIYRQQLDSIQIIAIAHAKRRPGYWRKRT
jgi:plasmid stabilization system protein ParE